MCWSLINGGGTWWDVVVSRRVLADAPPPHRPLPSNGCTNCGLMKEKFANSAWSMLAMTSSSGGVSWGCVRVKNLSKFSAPLPHWKRERKGDKCWTHAGGCGRARPRNEDEKGAKTHPLRDPPRCREGFNSIWATRRCALTAPRAASRPRSTCPPSRASWPTCTHLILTHAQPGGTNSRLEQR